LARLQVEQKCDELFYHARSSSTPSQYFSSANAFPCTQVMMQPSSASLQQFIALPLPVIDYLLTLDQLRVTSENTVLAAITYWLQQNLAAAAAAAVTPMQRQRLAYKLRLLNCTPSYLLHIFSQQGHWLTEALTEQQRNLLIAGSSSSSAYQSAMQREPQGGRSVFFGSAKAAAAASAAAGGMLSWWKKPRCHSSMDTGQLDFEFSLDELWALYKQQKDEATSQQPKNGGQKGGISSKALFYGGFQWRLRVGMYPGESLNRESDTMNDYCDGPSTIGCFLECVTECAAPIMVSGALFAKTYGDRGVGFDRPRYVAMKQVPEFKAAVSFHKLWGSDDVYEMSFSSCQDAQTRLLRKCFLNPTAGNKVGFCAEIQSVT
jgi:hypothetical protein